jgi:hypothetical protein
MNKIDIYKIAFMPLYKRLASHYKGLFYNGPKTDMAKHLLSWIEAISKSNIPTEHLNEFNEHLITQSKTYSKFPPNPTEYVAAYKEWEIFCLSSNSNITDDFIKEFDVFYRRMSIRYEGLWARNEMGSMESHYEFWKDDIFENNIVTGQLKLGFDKLRTMQQFRLYPPNIDQFMDILMIVGSDTNVPAVEEAYTEAISSQSSSDLHPLIQHVRRKYGYIKLVENNYGVKGLFENDYRNSLVEFLAGRLTLENTAPVEEEDQITAAPLLLNSTLDDILSGFG